MIQVAIPFRSRAASLLPYFPQRRQGLRLDPSHVRCTSIADRKVLPGRNPLPLTCCLPSPYFPPRRQGLHLDPSHVPQLQTEKCSRDRSQSRRRRQWLQRCGRDNAAVTIFATLSATSARIDVKGRIPSLPAAGPGYAAKASTRTRLLVARPEAIRAQVAH